MPTKPGGGRDPSGTSDEPVQLYAKTTLGLLTPIQGLVGEKLETVPSTSKGVTRKIVGKNKTVELPEEIEKLVDETRSVINPQQTDQFRQLLIEYRGVFSTEGELLGWCDVVQHEIKTKVPYRRIPVGLREEAVKEDNRMKALG